MGLRISPAVPQSQEGSPGRTLPHSLQGFCSCKSFFFLTVPSAPVSRSLEIGVNLLNGLRICADMYSCPVHNSGVFFFRLHRVDVRGPQGRKSWFRRNPSSFHICLGIFLGTSPEYFFFAIQVSFEEKAKAPSGW